MNSYQKNKRHWNCRRGLLELDLILERFLKTDPAEKEFMELLELPDNDLLDIVMGRSDAYGAHLTDIVARIRSA